MQMRWTAEEDRRLLELKQQGKHVALIAKELGRTETAVSDRLAHLRRRQQ
jgi:Myb-like DNA-binding domain